MSRTHLPRPRHRANTNGTCRGAPSRPVVNATAAFHLPNARRRPPLSQHTARARPRQSASRRGRAREGVRQQEVVNNGLFSRFVWETFDALSGFRGFSHLALASSPAHLTAPHRLTGERRGSRGRRDVPHARQERAKGHGGGAWCRRGATRVGNLGKRFIEWVGCAVCAWRRHPPGGCFLCVSGTSLGHPALRERARHAP